MAGIVQGAFAASSLGALGDGALYRLTTALILAKYGYDCRGMVALDPAWGSSPDRYAHALQSVQTLGQMTAWLEYYSGAALTAYTDVFEAMSHSPTRQDMGKTMSFGTLSDRELRVLSRLEAPTSKITNRDVQGMFRLSQVTISRMLSALTAKGLLAAHRRGRSTYYTKI
jgi:Fic family protein